MQIENSDIIHQCRPYKRRSAHCGYKFIPKLLFDFVSEFQYTEPQPITDPSPLPLVDYGTPYQILSNNLRTGNGFMAELRRRYLDRMIVAGGGVTL
ncbi:hypothetical protein J6590_041499 [Homalodisca vitripennis]|nr:hypothetical protein J6590_041499 [Homalodisca vitripennis]